MENKKPYAVMSSEQLKKLREVDIRTVDRDTLADIADVKIDTSLPDKDRIQDYLRQVKNPYCFLANGMVVKISFSGRSGLSLTDCMKNYLLSKNGNE